jgi:two-component system, chemotaxis family, chemotaxis protein CheY
MGDNNTKKKIRVLIVDDNESDRIVIRTMLSSLGFADIQEAEDGLSAENKIANANQIKQPFGLVLLDWMMPKQTGIKVLQHLRTERANRDLIIFMTTGKSDFEKVNEAARSGVDDYIVKPVTLDVLKTKIAKHFP